ncbi:hypothetical protein WKK05_22475 [Nostoc sp. UHCC 0302]|uniref:hypothetical protein n=1 Tax=Nostoc sp. UHCC 0302 TaxID=3134896 RepID=UPI00311CC4AD
MRATTGSVHRNSPPQATQAYPPSVPLSVYRELSVELQATQARLDALTTQNQQLLQENQVLRREITKVVHSFSHLQKFVNSSNTFDERQVPHPTVKPPVNEARSSGQSPRPRPPVATKVPPGKNRRQEFSVPMVDMNFPMSQPIFIEEQEVRYYPTAEPEAKQLSGWWFVIAIILIMLTAFSAGYLFVRPMFEHQNR